MLDEYGYPYDDFDEDYCEHLHVTVLNGGDDKVQCLDCDEIGTIYWSNEYER